MLWNHKNPLSLKKNKIEKNSSVFSRGGVCFSVSIMLEWFWVIVPIVDNYARLRELQQTQ